MTRRTPGALEWALFFDNLTNIEITMFSEYVDGSFSTTITAPLAIPPASNRLEPDFEREVFRSHSAPASLKPFFRRRH